MLRVCEFTTVEDFWKKWSFIPRPGYASYSLFIVRIFKLIIVEMFSPAPKAEMWKAAH
jgi:hypothetical protein